MNKPLLFEEKLVISFVVIIAAFLYLGLVIASVHYIVFPIYLTPIILGGLLITFGMLWIIKWLIKEELQTEEPLSIRTWRIARMLTIKELAEKAQVEEKFVAMFEVGLDINETDKGKILAVLGGK